MEVDIMLKVIEKILNRKTHYDITFGLLSSSMESENAIKSVLSRYDNIAVDMCCSTYTIGCDYDTQCDILYALKNDYGMDCHYLEYIYKTHGKLQYYVTLSV
jgi:hypothetical protein